MYILISNFLTSPPPHIRGGSDWMHSTPGSRLEARNTPARDPEVASPRRRAAEGVTEQYDYNPSIRSCIRS